MNADVYRCLHEHKPTWSVKSRESEDYGRVRTHTDALIMKNVEMVVQNAGRERALEEGQKNVHAFCRGRVLYTLEDRNRPDEMLAFPSGTDTLPIKYRPEWGSFKGHRGLVTVTEADTVAFHPDGTCVAARPTIKQPLPQK